MKVKDKWIDWDLLARHMEGKLSREEETRFNEWLAENDEHEKYHERMVAEWNNESLRERDLSRLLLKFEILLQEGKKRRGVVARKRVLVWSVAAVLLVVIGMSWYTMLHQAGRGPAIPLAGITPGQSKARLVMHDGTSVHLDNMTDSSSFVIGSTRIENNKGTVTFTSDAKPFEKVEYNTLSVPRNGEYHVVLNDGTAVWLNAETTLKFPARFENGNRHVILSGEAYFQVSRDSSSPFVVETSLGEIKVYGTEFNVRRHLDERAIRVTLVNGSVGFRASESHGGDFKMIEPGYQACYELGGKVIVKKVKVFNEIAWHKQLFSFEHCPLDEIMKDVARWYDVEVSFDEENLKDLYFTCTLDRYDKIEKLLRFFEEVHDISFKIEGKHVTVMKK